MTRLRFAIVGTNFISDRFVCAVRETECAEVVAVYSRQLDTGRLFADKYGINKVYDDYSLMLADAEIDAVYIASPTFCHAEQTESALLSGKHALVEKMICTEADELRGLRRIAEERDLVLLEAMRPDFDPAYTVLRESLSRIGKIRRATLEFCQYSSRYDKFKSGEVLNAFDPKIKNSALADIGIYPLHTAMMLFGAPRSMSAHSVFLHNGFEGAGNITLDYGDALCHVVYSKISDSVNPSVIEGECGSVIINKISAPTRIDLIPRTGEAETVFATELENNMVFEVESFVAMTRGELSAERYLDASIESLLAVEEAYRQTGARAKME